MPCEPPPSTTAVAADPALPVESPAPCGRAIPPVLHRPALSSLLVQITQARRDGFQGRAAALLRFTVAADGRVVDTAVERTSGSPAVDRALQRWARHLVFAASPVGFSEVLPVRVDD